MVPQLIWFAAGMLSSYLLTDKKILEGLFTDPEPLAKPDEGEVTEYRELPKWSKRKDPVTLKEFKEDRRNFEESLYEALVEASEGLTRGGENMVERLESFRKKLDKAQGCCGGTKDDCCGKH